MNPFSLLDVIILHSSISLFFACFSFYYLCRSVFKCSLESSIFAGVFWGYSSYFIALYYLLGSLEAFLWIPVFCWALVYSKKNIFISIAVLTIGSCEQFLTGRLQEQEIATFAVIAFVFYYVWNFSGNITNNERLMQIFKYGLIYISAALLMLIITAPSVYEQFNLITQSSRGITSPGTSQCTPSILNFLTVIPYSGILFNLNEGCGNEAYFGFVGLLLILLILKFSWKQTKPLVLIGFAVMLFTYRIKIGSFNIFDIYTHLPGHIGVRYAQRFIPFALFFLTLALAIGLDKINFNETFKKIRWVVIAFILVNFEFLNSLTRFNMTKEKWFTFDTAFLVYCILLTQLLSLIFLLLNKNQKASWVSLILLLIINSYLLNWTYTKGARLNFYFNNIYNSKELDEIISLVDKNKDDYRFICEGEPEARGACAYLVSNGFRIATGYFTFLNFRMFNYFTKILNGEYTWSFYIDPLKIDSKMFYLSNVRYWLHKKGSSNDIPATHLTGLKKLYSSKNYDLFEFDSVLPRAYFANEIMLVDSQNEIDSIKNKLSLDKKWFNQGAYIFKDKDKGSDPGGNNDEYKLPPPNPALSKNTLGTIEKAKYKNSRFLFKTHSSKDQYFILQENIDKHNWRATIDGLNTPLLRANLISSAIFVPAGDHAIVFHYELPHILLFLTVAGLSLLILLLGVGIWKICMTKPTDMAS